MRCERQLPELDPWEAIWRPAQDALKPYGFVGELLRSYVEVLVLPRSRAPTCRTFL